MRTCPNCGRTNRDVARFCNQCSQPLTANLVCVQCGTANPNHAKFCLQCAAPLRGHTPLEGLQGTLSLNTRLANRYTIQKQLGLGGMGKVYLALDDRLQGKLWAVKELSDTALTSPQEKQEALERFKQEGSLLSGLNHPNLPRVIDFFDDGSRHYLVMEYVEGKTLEELVDGRTSPFPQEIVISWAGQLCDVLGYLHGQKPPIIFRDLKPGNIMVDNNNHVKLIDFGIARLFKPGKSKDTASFGTAGYAPPEQYGKGQTDARSDVYSLGATLHHVLTLREPADEPFNFPTVTSLNRNVTPAVNAAIMKAVDNESINRWPSISKMKEALLKKTQPAPSAPPPKQSAPTPQPSQTAPPRQAAQPTKAPIGVQRASFWGYVFTVGVMMSLLYALGAYVSEPLYYELGELGLIAFWVLIAIPPLAASAITKRPGAFFLTMCVLLIPYDIWYEFLPIQHPTPYFFEDIIPPVYLLAYAFAVEFILLLSRYEKYTFGPLFFAQFVGVLAIAALFYFEGEYFEEFVYIILILGGGSLVSTAIVRGLARLKDAF